jgi:hypothetical protein
MSQTAQKSANPADDSKKAASAPAAAPAAAPDASGSHAGTVTIKAAEAALMLGETVAYHSIRSGADEIATWINTASDLPETARIAIVESGNPWNDSLAYCVLRDELDREAIDAEYRIKQNNDILKPPPPAPKVKAIDGEVGNKMLVVPTPLDKLLADIVAGADPLKPVTAILASANTAIGYFRADYAIASARTTPSDDALQAMLAEKITRCPVYLLSGATYSSAAEAKPGVDAQGESAFGAKRLLAGLGELYRLAHAILAGQGDALAAIVAKLSDAAAAVAARIGSAQNDRAEIRARVANLDRKRIDSIANAQVVALLDAEIAAEEVRDAALVETMAEHSAGKAKLEAALIGPRAALDATVALIKRIDEFLQDIATGASGMPKLAEALRHEWMLRLGITHLLQASCISAGHETLTEQGPIYKIAQMQRLYLLGSSVIRYKLTAIDGLKVKTDALARASRMAIKLGDGSVTDIESLKVA